MIAAVVLAAGGSARLGSPKQLVSLRGKSLLRHAVECCAGAGCDPVLAVLGASRERVEPELQGLSVQVVANDGWREGVASSIRSGVAALPPDVRAVLLVVCDQPRLTPSLLRRLIVAYDGAPGRMIASEYGGAPGVPALFGRDRFPDLLELRGDRGAKPLFRRCPGDVLRIAWPEGAIDVDRPEDRRRIR